MVMQLQAWNMSKAPFSVPFKDIPIFQLWVSADETFHQLGIIIFVRQSRDQVIVSLAKSESQVLEPKSKIKSQVKTDNS